MHLVSQVKSIHTLRIHQFAGITAKMGKNFVISDAVVGGKKKNQNCFGSVAQVIRAGHQCRIHVEWLDGTTTDETVCGH